MEKILNYIGGRFQEPGKGSFIPDLDPATGNQIALVPDSDADDINEAVTAANSAFPEWSDSSITDRSRILHQIADLIDENLESLARDESVDNGKPVKLAARVDIPRASANFRYFAEAITQFHSQAFDMGKSGFNYTLRRPIGIAGLISPWNLPLYLFTWKIAPAIAAGNTAVAKPSEITPLTAFRLSQICKDAGLPPGVLNIVHGTGPKAGAALVSHPLVPAISFTGSTKTGKTICEIAGPMFKKLSLEMGGKNPNIVFADSNFESAVSGSVKAAFTNQGQICLCGSRIFVEKTIYEKFLSAFVAETKKLTIGDPLEPDTRIGAIVSRDQYQKDLAYIELAKQEGGKIETGGKPAAAPNDRCARGLFIEPTVITGLGPFCRTNQEEIFGPLVTIYPFQNEEEAIVFSNATEYGLSATIWTENLKRAHRVAARLHSGIVWVNSWLVRDLRTPFGGVKNSGIGREGGFHALEFFTEPKNIFIQL